ncbi:MAG: hypothetical protein GY772_14300 [bacterium]|nr:hypothetical protein [bacterium]
MGGRASRNKGAAFERRVAEIFREIYPEARRGYQRRSGSDEPDVAGTPWWIECKVGKATPQVYRAWWQAMEATDGRACMVVSKQDRTEILVTLQLADLLALLERAAGQSGLKVHAALDADALDLPSDDAAESSPDE